MLELLNDNLQSYSKLFHKDCNNYKLTEYSTLGEAETVMSRFCNDTGLMKPYLLDTELFFEKSRQAYIDGIIKNLLPDNFCLYTGKDAWVKILYSSDIFKNLKENETVHLSVGISIDNNDAYAYLRNIIAL